MDNEWQLQDAKNKFSEVVEHALHDGPQAITRRGRKTAFLISVKEYQRLKGRKGTLVEFFRDSPLQEIPFERSRDLPREIRL